MRKEETIILERKDIIDGSRGKTIHDIKFSDFKISIRSCQESSLVLFIDNNGSNKILKKSLQSWE